MVRSFKSVLALLALLASWGFVSAQDQTTPAEPVPSEAAAPAPAPEPANDNNGMSAGMDTTNLNTIDKRPDCFSCLIPITDELTEFGAKLSLQGNWLFAKGGEGTDDYDFMNPTLDTKDWVLLKTPGKWSDAYPGDKPFKSGWYRAVLDTGRHMGKEWVMMIPARLGKVTVYMNGEEIYRRPGNYSVERFYANQPIPVLMPTKGTALRTIVVNIENPTEDGIYEHPFELRRYSTNDNNLTFQFFRGGEFRLMAAAIAFFYGMFFLQVFLQTRDRLYITAALASFTATPYLILPTDLMLRTFDPDTMAFAQYFGMVCVFFYYLFCQHFDKFTPKLNWVFGLVTFGTSIACGAFAFQEAEARNMELFEPLRVTLSLSAIAMIALSIYHTLQGVRRKRDGSIFLFVGMLSFAVMYANDVLIGRGVIQGTVLSPIDNVLFLGIMIYVAASSFARTFKDNIRLVTDLKGINDNLEQIVSERTAQLREKTNDIQNMLENMPQGILTIVRDGTIHPEYSRYLETIFGSTDIAGKPAMGMIFGTSTVGSDARSQVEATIDSVISEDRMNFDFNSHLLVSDIDIKMSDGRIKYLDLSWSPICDENDTVDKLMVCVRDVTELRKLEAEAGQQKRELEMIGQILTVNQEKFHEFVDSARKFVAENDELLRKADDKSPDMVAQLFRNMHTIKGNARTYGLLHLTNIVHEAEQAYDELRKNPEAEFQKEELLSQLQEVTQNIEEYASLNEVKLGRKGPGRRGSAEKYVMVKREHVDNLVSDISAVNIDTAAPATLTKLVKELEVNLRLIGTETIQSILDGVFDSLPSLAKELDKAPPKLVVRDNGVHIRNQVADLLRNVFMHLYRNSMDHGIEAVADRQAKGKPEAGTIELGLSVEHGKLQMRLKDDGKGLALGYIRKKGIEKGMVPESGAMPDEEVAMLIFAAGFSTAAAVTEVSGRGVGMDAVQDFVKREGGSIELKFTDAQVGADYRAFETVISMPEQFAVATA